MPTLAETQGVMQTSGCYGLSQSQMLKIGLLKGILAKLNPAIPTDNPSLLQYGKCFQCFGMSIFQVLEMSLLDLIKANSGCPDEDEGVITVVDVQPDTLRFGAINNLTELHLPNATDFTDLTLFGELAITACPNFILLDAPLLQTTAGSIFCSYLPITTLDLPSLSQVGLTLGSLVFNTNPNLSSVNVPLLQSVSDSILCGSNPLITLLSFPQLLTVGIDFDLTNNTSMATLSLPLLQSIGNDFTGPGCSVLTTLSLPSLTTIGNDLIFGDCTILSSFSAPNWLPTNGKQINFQNCALDEPSIGRIFARCVAAGVTTCIISVNGGTNAGQATWTIPTQNDFIALTVAGNTIVFNP